jgi:alcohol dehydrogenase
MNSPFGVMRAPRAIHFGCGQRVGVGRVAALLGKRVLVCTDARFAASEDMPPILASLSQQGLRVEVFADTQPELPVEGIYACVARFKSFQPDVIIGLGGGSCMDLAKLVALLLAHQGSLDQYYGEFKVPGPIVPVIAIATTAGTGSEVTPVAVVGDDARDLKVGISSPHLIPHTAICDPELTVSCPRGLTALSAADALTHAIEAFTAIRHPQTPDLPMERVFVGKNAFSDNYALEAIKAIANWLPRGVADGSDMEARSKLMYGAVCAGLAFGVAGTAAAHAIQYPVGALTHTAHGLGVATLLPYVMAFNADYCTDELAQIGDALQVGDGSVKARAQLAVQAVSSLCKSVGIPSTLAELGVPADRLGWIAEQSMKSARLVNNNPRPLDVESVAALVTSAFTGHRQPMETLA